MFLSNLYEAMLDSVKLCLNTSRSFVVGTPVSFYIDSSGKLLVEYGGNVFDCVLFCNLCWPQMPGMESRARQKAVLEKMKRGAGNNQKTHTPKKLTPEECGKKTKECRNGVYEQYEGCLERMSTLCVIACAVALKGVKKPAVKSGLCYYFCYQGLKKYCRIQRDAGNWCCDKANKDCKKTGRYHSSFWLYNCQFLVSIGIW